LTKGLSDLMRVGMSRLVQPLAWRWRGRWFRFRRMFNRSRATLFGLSVLVAVLAVAAMASFLLMKERVRVVDGDTVRYQGRTVRLVGFDTPETGDRAQCEYERALGARAATRLSELVKSGEPRLEFVPCACPPGTEGTASCNFGRSCGSLTIDGRDVGSILIAEGLARPFRCGSISCPRRAPWC
jgi:endonuclease YncB( thermonuclease family)